MKTSKKEKLILEAIDYGDTYALEFFKEMLNGKRQGNGFSWECFPDLVKRLAVANAYMSFNKKDFDKFEEDIIVNVEKASYERAKILCCGLK